MLNYKAVNADKKKAGKKKKSMSKKLSMSVLAILVPSLIVLIVVAGTMASKAIAELNEENLKVQTNYAVSIVNGFFENKLSAAELISVNPAVENYIRNTKTIEEMNNYSEKAELMHQLGDAAAEMKNENVQAVWIANFADEQMLYSTGELLDAGMDNANWDDLVINTGKSAVSDPYIDPLTGDNLISIVAPVFMNDGSTVVGAVGLDVFLSTLNDELGDIKIGDAGYLELLSTESVYIVSDDPTAIGKNVSELEIDDDYKEKVKSRYEGMLTFTYAGIAYRSLASISDATNWLAIATLPQAEVDATRNQLIFVLFVLSVVILLILIIIITSVVHKMLSPLAEVGRNVQEFAKGNLEVKILFESDDEIGRLADNVRGFMENLKFIIRDIKHIMSEMSEGNFRVKSMGLDYYKGDFDAIILSMRNLRDRMNSTLNQIDKSSEQVSYGSSQLSSASQGLSQGATEQASAVEELAATINEISNQIKNTAMHADEARKQTAESGAEIIDCNKQMQEMIESMDEISEKSGQISRIIKTIEDIAFQTNILALNAAVEAARAGEAGKGFAVVADEVRNLASKSSEASKSTAALIESTVRAVEKGTGIASTTASALKSVVEGSNGMVASVDKIASATEQQSVSVSQVTQVIEQISRVVQTNSATAEESAAAGEELAGQAQMLKGLVDQFNLNDDQSFKDGQNPKEG